MHVAPADEQDRARVDELARAVREAPARAWSRPSGTEASLAKSPPKRRRSAASVRRWPSPLRGGGRPADRARTRQGVSGAGCLASEGLGYRGTPPQGV